MAVVFIAVFCSSCGSNNSTSNSTKDSTTAGSISTDTLKAQKPESLQPAGEKPAWGKNLTDPMAVVIEKLKSFNAPPIVTLSAVEARKQPSPADAVKAVMQQHSIAVPPNNIDTIGKDIMVPGGKIHLRIYTPKTGKDVYPVIVYYHGGGWVIADLKTYDASAAGLANMVEAVVVSVAYRQAPENKFPVAHNDSYAA
ncbi:MAG: alpha/beta hydrolase, partial [Ferruginibacter sp.]|nr:alpha/beta hydrolase [Ferruginibacter sp.]